MTDQTDKSALADELGPLWRNVNGVHTTAMREGWSVDLYVRTISAALRTSTDPKATRAEVLREAAEVALQFSIKAHDEVHSYDSYGGPSLPGRAREVARGEAGDEIRAAILALIPKETPDAAE